MEGKITREESMTGLSFNVDLTLCLVDLVSRLIGLWITVTTAHLLNTNCYLCTAYLFF